MSIYIVDHPFDNKTNVQYGPPMFNMVHQCSIWFTNVQYGSSMFNMVHQCSIWFINVQYGPPMFNMVHQCSIWSTNVQYGSPMFNMVHQCSIWSRTSCWLKETQCMYYLISVEHRVKDNSLDMCLQGFYESMALHYLNTDQAEKAYRVAKALLGSRFAEDPECISYLIVDSACLKLSPEYRKDLPETYTLKYALKKYSFQFFCVCISYCKYTRR